MRKLQEARKKKGLSQSELARIAGVNLQTLQRYENGIRTIDSARLDIAFSLALALECKLSDLIEDRDLMAMVQDYEKILIIDDFRQQAIESIKNK